MKELYVQVRDRLLRRSRKLSDVFFAAAALMVIHVFAGSLVGMLVTKIPVIRNAMASLVYSASMVEFLDNYLIFIGIWLVILPIVIIFPANRPMLKAIKYSHRGNNLKGFIFGILMGFGTNGLCVLLSLMSGDIKLSFYGFDFVVLLVFAIAVFIQSGAEELADRFYLYQKLRRRYRHPLWAVLVNSLAFTLLHVGNPGFTVVSGIQIFLIGIVFSMMVYYYNNLWGAMAFHAAWNFTQNLIFGLPNSGIVSEYSIFALVAASARDGLFYNVNFGVEGSVGACALLAVIAVAIFVINRNRPEANDVWAESERQAEERESAAEVSEAGE
ncbi:MAG: CPBP family intramembrane metalloprotease [Erysipelotrichaceae bacterium]|nr:CPBP family intramembrane metalloprotease [Erysipelotrichaceae bacterium]